MDLNTLVWVVLLVLSLIAVILFVTSDIIRSGGIRDAFNSGDESRLNATGAKILSEAGISNSFNLKDKAVQNLEFTTLDTNKNRNSSSGESSTNPTGTGNAEENLLRNILNFWYIRNYIIQLIYRRFGRGKDKNP